MGNICRMPSVVWSEKPKFFKLLTSIGFPCYLILFLVIDRVENKFNIEIPLQFLNCKFLTCNVLWQNNINSNKGRSLYQVWSKVKGDLIQEII